MAQAKRKEGRKEQRQKEGRGGDKEGKREGRKKKKSCFSLSRLALVQGPPSMLS